MEPTYLKKLKPVTPAPTGGGGAPPSYLNKLKPVANSESTFTERVDQAITPRAEAIKEDVKSYKAGNQGLGQTIFNVGGQTVGAAFDPLVEGIKTATPEIIKKPVRSALGFLQKGIGVAADVISESKPLQKFAQTETSKSLERSVAAGNEYLNILPVPKGLGTLNKGLVKGADLVEKAAPIVKKPIIGAKNVAEDIFVKPADQLKAERVTEGYLEQNKRLKTAENAHNENTKVYKEKDAEGNIVERKVTPVDTLAKYNITPVVEKGGLNMGDYRTGTGALGRIKEEVAKLEDQIETKIKENSSPTGIKIDDFKASIEEKIKSNTKLKRSGKVETTLQKLEKVIDDYKNSYGDSIPEIEINAIRKVMNQDWDLETMDLSRVIGDTARDIVYNVTPDQAVKKMLLENGELMGAKNYAETINNTRVTGGRLGNMFLRTTGAMLGSTLDRFPFVGALLGMLGGEYAARALQQSQFKTPLGELKGLFQRSNKSQPTTNANSTAPSSIPGILPPKAESVIEGKVDKGSNLLNKANKAMPSLKEALLAIPNRRVDTRVKTPESLAGKIKRYEQKGLPIENIADTLGGRIVVDESNLKSTFDSISKKFNVTEVENFFETPHPFGYSGYNIKVKLPDGTPAEIQIHTPLSLSKSIRAHKPYEAVRDLDYNNLSPDQQIAVSQVKEQIIEIMKEDVFKFAEKKVKEQGGATIGFKDILGKSEPTKGYAYARDKSTETIIPQDKFNSKSVEDYFVKHASKFADPRNHLGLWVDNGKVYIDVSTVENKLEVAKKEAKSAQQLAIFDLEKFNTINLGD